MVRNISRPLLPGHNVNSNRSATAFVIDGARTILKDQSRSQGSARPRHRIFGKTEKHTQHGLASFSAINSMNSVFHCIRCDLNRVFQYRLWGGRHSAARVHALPGDGPIGEAWLLSDRDEHLSKVADGPLKGMTIRRLVRQSPEQLMGRLAGRFQRFPVLLKFLDAQEKL